MTNLLSPVAKAKFFDNNGRPAVGYKVFTYAAGTNTKLDSYPSADSVIPNSNPIVLNFRGEADIWFPPNVAYKVVFSPPDDTDPPTAQIWTVDDIVDSQLVTLWGGVDTGIANAYVLNFVANFTSYTDGIVIYWIPSNTNTGASTINVNGLGPVPITNQDGSALYFGQLQANQVALIVYRSTGFTLVATSLLPTLNSEPNDYTFQISDGSNIVLHTGAVAHAYTVPANASVPYPLATSIDIVNDSSESLTVAPDAGVTLRPFGQALAGAFTMDPRTSTRITKIGSNTWVQFNQSDLVFEQGTFTGSVSGMTAALDITITFFRNGNVVTLKMPSSGTLTGTSNATSMQISGVPTSLRPKLASKKVLCSALFDNGAVVVGEAEVGTAGTIILRNGIPPGAFTNSGTKGFQSSWNITYPL